MNPILLINFKIMKQKYKNKYKKTVINYISKDVFDDLKQIKTIHPLIKNLCFEGFNSRELAVFFTLRSLLFCLLKINPSEILVYEELNNFLSKILALFYRFNLDGYVNKQNMELNEIFNIFRSFFPFYKDVFAQGKKSLSSNHELEHFHNLIILILLFEIELYIKHFSLCEIETENGSEKENLKETVCLLKQERSTLNKTLSGGIRVSITRNRLVLTDRIYLGFDTEYKNIDCQTNDILCYSTASITEGLLKVRNNTVDFSLKEGKVYLPKTASLIDIGVKLIRLLRCKKDRELEKLENFLRRKDGISKKILHNGDVIYKQTTFDVKNIRSCFYDLRSDKSQYSLKNLLDSTINSNQDSIPNSKVFLNYVKKFNLKPVFRPECYLMAHFTAADVSLFSDFEEVKSKFTVLNKSFLSLNTSFSYRK